ncbi:MAG TPA: hypothetical protein VGE05_04870 [Novosphingobium sp.]
MSGFLFAFLAVLLACVGARDLSAVAGLVERQGARPGVLVTGIASSIATAVITAWAASFVAPMLAADARTVLGAMALAFAGGESLLLSGRLRKPEEPTLSLGALALVLLARQLTDAARFLVFGIAVATGAPVAAGMGGAFGGAAGIALAWMAPMAANDARIGMIRRAIGIVLLGVALYVVLRGLGRA